MLRFNCRLRPIRLARLAYRFVLAARSLCSLLVHCVLLSVLIVPALIFSLIYSSLLTPSFGAISSSAPITQFFAFEDVFEQSHIVSRNIPFLPPLPSSSRAARGDVFALSR